MRARRPTLPQPGAAVLSAMAGLTAGFGMGPGDPRLRGRARAGRSRRSGAGPRRPGGCMARNAASSRVADPERPCRGVREELGRLVPLA